MTLADEVIGYQPLPAPITEFNLPESWGLLKESGKVRDVYHLGNDRLILIATDRLSAFDRVLTHIPGRGQILNQLSTWWFERTSDIASNHVIAVPDLNVMVVRQYPRIPIEMVVRGFLTGSTGTSIWIRYTQGEREFGGLVLPEMIRLVLEKYIVAYERLTGQSFEIPTGDPQERIIANLKKWFTENS